LTERPDLKTSIDSTLMLSRHQYNFTTKLLFKMKLKLKIGGNTQNRVTKYSVKIQKFQKPACKSVFLDTI
jgi:hypothetical protein